MLKKSNFFFKSLEKFKTRNAIITENGKYITYQELLLSSEKISNKLHAKKS